MNNKQSSKSGYKKLTALQTKGGLTKMQRNLVISFASQLSRSGKLSQRQWDVIDSLARIKATALRKRAIKKSAKKNGGYRNA